jgi:hypothetical protein
MPYPFIQWPTLGEFVARVKSEYQAEIKEINMSGPRGRVNTKVLIRSGKEGGKRIAVIPDLKDDDHLVTSVLRSLCIQLGIPSRDFGLYLD